MLWSRRLLAVISLSAFCALAVAAPSNARSEHAQGGVVAGVAAEFVKVGAKAAIARFAPGLNKHIDPTSHELSLIRDQLAALDAKLTELQNYQQAVEHHLNCAVQRTHLHTILASADTHLSALVDVGRLPLLASRVTRLDALYNSYILLSSQQRELHLAVSGADGALRACAKHIEMSQRPFLTSQLAPAVRDFYAAYEAAALSLLTVRVNIINYRPDDFPLGKEKEIVDEVNHWLLQEQALIKPAMPNSESYETTMNLLFKTNVVGGHGNQPQVQALRNAGWLVTGETYSPTCGVIIRLVSHTGLSGAAAINELRRRNVIDLPPTIRCYDDHDSLHLFHVAELRYERAGLTLASIFGKGVAARSPHGFFNLSHYSYTL